MNTRELMIGNHVLHNGKYVTIDSISDSEWFNISVWDGYDGSGGGYDYNSIKEIEGIPLNHETMKRLGYDLSKTRVIEPFYEFSIYGYITNGSVDIAMEQYSEGEIYLKHIRFVHQLQNLIYTLTGQEIKFKY